MDENREIKIRPVFRVLAGFLTLVALLPIYFDPAGALEFYFGDWHFLLSWLVVIPVVCYSAVFGKMPLFITRRLSKDMFDMFADVSPLFTKFNAASIACAVVFLVMAAFTIYRGTR